MLKFFNNKSIISRQNLKLTHLTKSFLLRVLKQNWVRGRAECQGLYFHSSSPTQGHQNCKCPRQGSLFDKTSQIWYLKAPQNLEILSFCPLWGIKFRHFQSLIVSIFKFLVARPHRSPRLVLISLTCAFFPAFF